MFDQLKPYMQNGERYVVVEGGKPQYVLMRFGDYITLVSGKRTNPGYGNPRPTDGWEGANAELDEVRARTESARPELAAEPVSSPADPTTIRLEDLPL